MRTDDPSPRVTCRNSGEEHSKTVQYSIELNPDPLIAGFVSWRCDVELKQQMLRAIEELPDDASVEDGIERLYLIHKIERGMRQADDGELISQEEARSRMAQWLK